MRENGNDVLFCDCVEFCMCPVKENSIHLFLVMLFVLFF